MGNELSEERLVSIGNWQGSSLSCCLLLVILADVRLFAEFSSVHAFSDDHTSSTKGSDLNAAIRKAQIDASNIIRYFRLNRLSINAKKCEFTVIRPTIRNMSQRPVNDSHKSIVQIEIDGNIITESRAIRVLGLHISNTLSFEPHIDYVNKKCRQILGTTKRISYLTQPKCVKQIVQATVCSVIACLWRIFLHCT